MQQHLSHIIFRLSILDRCALEACRTISKTYVFTCPHQKRGIFKTTRFQITPLLKPFWKVFVLISVFGRCSVDDRPKCIKTFAALTENSLVCMGPSTTSRANYECPCENRYPRGKVTGARREGGRRVTLSPWPCFLHSYLLIGRRGKWNTLLFEKRSRRRLRWCCLSLIGRGECHRLDAVALAES